MSLFKNQEIELTITGTTHEGFGVGKHENQVVFTAGCAQGDTILAKIISVKKNLAYGKLLRVIQPSPARIPVDCPAFFQCGGCAFRHISYEQELMIKQERVRDAIRKIGHLELNIEPIVGSPSTGAYRNKAQYPVGFVDGQVKIGFYGPRSHRIVEAKNCLLQPLVFEKALAAFRIWIDQAGISIYDEASGEGLLRHIYLRLAQATEEWMACAVINGESLPSSDLLLSELKKISGLASVVCNCNCRQTNVILGKQTFTVWGKDTITDRLCGKSFAISPQSFYQVNREQAENLYRHAAAYAGLTGNELLLDLYCGAGTIGLCLSDRAKKVIGVEIVPEAVADARRNASLNGIMNAEFICADAGTAAERLLRDGLRPDVVVVDPPRKGLDSVAVDAIVRMAPKRIVYVSCDPATLARDLAIFKDSGYLCERIKPFDMFPRTAHVETVVLMSRADK